MRRKKYVESANEKLLNNVEVDRILEGGRTTKSYRRERRTSWTSHYIDSLPEKWMK